MKLAPSCEIFRDDVRSSSPSTLLYWTTRFDPTHCPCKMDGGLVWIWICVVDPAHSRAVWRSLAATSPSSAAPSSSAGMTRAFIVGATRRAPTTRPPSPFEGTAAARLEGIVTHTLVSSSASRRRTATPIDSSAIAHDDFVPSAMPNAPHPLAPYTVLFRLPQRVRRWEIQKAKVDSTAANDPTRRVGHGGVSP